MLEALKDKLRNVNKKFLAINLAVVAVGILAIGYIIRLVISNLGSFVTGEPFQWHLAYFLQPATWLTGGAIVWCCGRCSGWVADICGACSTAAFLAEKRKRPWLTVFWRTAAL